MTRDDIIRMAKEAGWKRVGRNPETGPEFPVLIERLERFAALVAAATKRKWAALTDEEFNDCLVAGDPCENLAEPEAWTVMKEVEAKLQEKNT